MSKPKRNARPRVSSLTSNESQGSRIVRPKKRTRKNQRKQTKSVTKNEKLEPTGIQEYGMALSQMRLLTCGFHPDILALTPEQQIQAWFVMARKYSEKPTFEEYRRELKINSTGNVTLNVTNGCFNSQICVCNENSNATTYELIDPNVSDGTIIQNILRIDDIAAIVAGEIFADGYGTAYKLAMTSKETWSSLALTANFDAAQLENRGCSRVFVAFAPTCTIGDIITTWVTYQAAGNIDSFKKRWHLAAMREEVDFLDTIWVLHKYFRDGRKLTDERRRQLAKVDHKTVAAIQILKETKGVAQVNQFVAKKEWQKYEHSVLSAGANLQAMLNRIDMQKNAIQVLHLHQIPLVDRRIVAVILKGCSNITMLGIYDCPLLHFGDTICILDFIFELNETRKRRGLARLESWDFYPHFYGKLGFQDGNSRLYGLTSTSAKLDVIQRGFFAIIMKAFLKAKGMNLKLLFDQGKALRAYLFKVPNPPLSVPSFLDALHRYVTLTEDDSYLNKKRQALYDILKPVRLGLDQEIENDWPFWYCEKMGVYSVFCSSCGYSMPEEFYTADVRDISPENRRCSACILQYWLDIEPPEQQIEKRTSLSILFLPRWQSQANNKDAPMPKNCGGLINLQSKRSKATYRMDATINHHGDVVFQPHDIQLTRHRRIQDDSLQNLPTLEWLTNDPRSMKVWEQLLFNCRNIDIRCRVLLCQVRVDRSEAEAVNVEGQEPRNQENLLNFDVKKPDKTESQFTQSYDFVTAATFYKGLLAKGW